MLDSCHEGARLTDIARKFSTISPNFGQMRIVRQLAAKRVKIPAYNRLARHTAGGRQHRIAHRRQAFNRSAPGRDKSPRYDHCSQLICRVIT